MIISKTPFRISFVGGGTDNLKKHTFSGNVISTTINKFIYVGLNKKFDRKIRFSYSKTENFLNANKLKHEMLKELLKHFNLSSGLEIISVADIPSEGSGLGSSSSFLVGSINCIIKYLKINLSYKQIAELACKIERNILRKPIGMQDPYNAVYGGLKWYNFTSKNVRVNHINIDQKRLNAFEQSLFLFYTQKTRKSQKILKNVKKNQNLKQLKELSNLAINFKNELIRGDLNLLGTILNESWKLKKELSNNTSNKYINSIYDHAIKSGATGGKLLGAGGGGFLLFFVENKHKKKFLNNMKKFELINFNFYNKGSTLIHY
jgi:D-glycero-alpha-D-manno-heptose-7-phosphate kinase